MRSDKSWIRKPLLTSIEVFLHRLVGSEKYMPSKFNFAMPAGSGSASAKPPIYKRKWFIVVAVLLVLGMIGNCSDGGRSSNDSSKSPSEITLSANTEHLEYSNKEVDPTTLVKSSDSKAEVIAKNAIDLKKVGTQTVTYEIVSNGETSEQTIDFVVKDTKAPVIELADENPSIDIGETYDPQAAIASVTDEIDGDLGFVDTPPESQGENTGIEDFYDSGWYTLEGSVDSSVPGAYPIKVTAADKHGNVTTTEVNVTVKEPVQETTEPAAETHTYILNASNGKFHNPGCSSVRQMNESNKVEITATREEMLANGYEPCNRCNP